MAAKKRRKAADKPASRKQTRCKQSAIAPAVAPPPAEKVIKIEATEKRQKVLNDGLLHHTIGRLVERAAVIFVETCGKMAKLGTLSSEFTRG